MPCRVLVNSFFFFFNDKHTTATIIYNGFALCLKTKNALKSTSRLRFKATSGTQATLKSVDMQQRNHEEIFYRYT